MVTKSPSIQTQNDKIKIQILCPLRFNFQSMRPGMTNSIATAAVLPQDKKNINLKNLFCKMKEIDSLYAKHGKLWDYQNEFF